MTVVLAVAGLTLDPGAALAQRERVLVVDTLFTDDHQWQALTSLEEPARRTEEEEAAGETGAGEVVAEGPERRGGDVRGSIDVDVVAAIISDRARQAGMLAVADAIEAVGGAGADRKYVRRLLLAAQAVLLGGGRLQRTHVEDLVKILVRMVLAEAIVRTRFPDASLLSRADYWERRLCGPGRGHRRPTSTSLRRCRRLRLGLPHGDVSATLVHLYLIDLAYWRLGARGFFDEYDPEPPTCPFPFGQQGNGLCQVLISGESDEERDARVDWVLNLDSVMDGLLVARALEPFWQADGTGLRGLLRALLHSDAIGTFGLTPGLRSEDWEATLEVLAQLEMLSEVRDIFQGYRQARAEPATADVRALAVSMARMQEILFGATGTCVASDELEPLPLCNTRGLRDWLVEVVRSVSTAAEARAAADGDKLPPVDPRVARAFERLAGRIARIEGTLTVLAGAEETVTCAAMRVSLEEQNAELHQVLWGANAEVDSPIRIDGLDLARLAEIVRRLHALATSLVQVDAALATAPAGWGPRQTAAGRRLARAARAMRGADRLLRLLLSLNLHTAREARLLTVGGALRGLEALGIGVRDGAVSARIFDLVEPVIGYLVEGRPADAGVLFRLAAGVRDRDVLAALGFRRRFAEACEGENEAGLTCWVVRILSSLREATQVRGSSIQIDGRLFRETLASLGDDFRTRHDWRWYFHLTIGLGQLATFGRTPGADPGLGNDARLSPFVAEQIGVGIASPAFCGDRCTFRFGAFGSGLLYRAVLDSAESDSMIFGGFVALDLYQLLELFVAPSVLLFPGEGSGFVEAQFGVAFGAQVPLSDYLAQL